MAFIEQTSISIDPTEKPAVTTSVISPPATQNQQSGYSSYPDGHIIHSPRPLEPVTHPPSGQDHPSKQDFGLTWD